MFASQTYARSVNIILVKPDSQGAVTEYTKHLGKETHELISKTVKAKLKHTKLNRYLKPLKDWRWKMPLRNDHYTYRVTWSEEDNEYVGLCAEFPSLSWLSKTPESALKGIRNTVAEIIKDMKENGEDIPLPIANKNYSGKFMVRLPPEVHRSLAIQAAESGVSINRLVSSRLSH